MMRFYHTLYGQRKDLFVFFMLMLIVASCKKKDSTSNDPIPAASISSVNAPDLTCMDLPPTPIPFGWTDTSLTPDKCINALFFNPLNPNEIIYIANGDLFGYNQMYLYNIPTKHITPLSSSGNFLPQVNKKGWIVFNQADLNIYKIKINGDSLTRLTDNNSGFDPHWNGAGDHIYFYQTALGTLPSQLVEMDKNGHLVNTMSTEFANTAVAHIHNNIAYLRSSGSTISVYYRDLAIGSETLVVSLQAGQGTFQDQFNYLAFDNTDENLYWANGGGIFRCNIAHPAIETVIANCANITYDRPAIASNGNKLTFSCHLKKPISSTRLLHQYKALELDLNTKQIHELRIFQ